MTGHFLHKEAVKIFRLCLHGTDEPGWISTLCQQIQCGWNGVPQLDTHQMQPRRCGKKIYLSSHHADQNILTVPATVFFFDFGVQIFERLAFKFSHAGIRYCSLPTERRVKVASGFTRGFKPLTGLCDTYQERSIEQTNQLEANREKNFIMSKWLIDLIFSGSYKLIACEIFGHILKSCTTTKIAAPLSRQIVKW